jgi:cytochrome c oxidase assembly factor CtaG
MAAVPVSVALILVGLLYAVLRLRLRRVSSKAIPGWRAAVFLLGLFSLWLAAGSPLAGLDEELLTAHMAQHLLLMTIGPALILLGLPGRRVSMNPILCWLAATAVLIGWHIPGVFALGLSSELWHHVEQATFLIAGFLFWWPVVPSGPGGTQPQWSIVIYLFMATLPCDALSAFLAFCGRVVYPNYLNVQRHFALSALQDQECAGALMWTSVTIAYLVPAALVTVKLLSSSGGSALGDGQSAF